MMHRVKEFIQSAMMGWIALGMVHIAAAWTGIGMGIGWLTAGIAGVLGVPGVVLLLGVNVLL